MFFLFRNYKTVKDLAAACKKPGRLSFYIWNRIWYVEGYDKKVSGKDEYFQPPDITVRVRQGDCDDHAWLMYDALGYMGVQDRHIIFTWPDKGPGHAYCFYWYDFKWYSYDSTHGNRKVKVPLLRDAIDKLVPEWKRYEERVPEGGTLKPIYAKYYGVNL